jgi:succinate dehydrogenase/fumarate reductase flavoprotein subunit
VEIAAVSERRWDHEFDVVVAGSGGAGLTAAILAHDNGARVAVLERSDKIGGTTAVSGGALWVPVNGHMADVEAQDSREEALAYCKRLSAGSSSGDLVETFVDVAAQMARYLEEHTPLRFSVWNTPDYYADGEGGKAGGRALEPEVFSKAELGEWAGALRSAPILTIPLTLEEMLNKYRLMTGLKNLPVDLLSERLQQQAVGMGAALVARLLKACLDRGITIMLETRATELVRDSGAVHGLVAERQDGKVSLAAKGGVVLATGGFEWNEGLVSKFMPGPLTHPNSPPFSEGDGLVMAMEAGAALANMNGAWWEPSGAVPGEMYEGRQLSRFLAAERSAPHAILVNRSGRRFVNEGAPYNDIGRAFHAFDPATYSYANLPCWSIFDSQYRRRYPVLATLPGMPDPEWLVRDDTLASLAATTGIDPSGLSATVERWNNFSRGGVDAEFHRGETAFERASGDARLDHPNLGTIEEPPFYALPVYAGALGTSGGPQTDSSARVLDVRGRVIAGLYAAGNAAASPTGLAYYSGGGTISPAMTWGYLAGIDAARNARKAA